MKMIEIRAVIIRERNRTFKRETEFSKLFLVWESDTPVMADKILVFLKKHVDCYKSKRDGCVRV